MNITTFQKKIVVISTIVASLGVIGGSAFKAVNWVTSSIVTKDFLTEKLEESKKGYDIGINDLRMLMIDESLARYYTMGLDNLTDQEKHHYNKLVLAEVANDEQRKMLLGL